MLHIYVIFFFFNDTATTEIYTLSLHDALPIYRCERYTAAFHDRLSTIMSTSHEAELHSPAGRTRRRGGVPECRPDRKSTRLNSSHMSISYAVFCLKKKKKQHSI